MSGNLFNAPLIVSLFDFSGNWPRYFRENGYRVIQVDETPHTADYPYEYITTDILNWDCPFDSAYGVLAAPPCTHLSNSGSRLWKLKDSDGRTDYAVQLIRKTLSIIDKLKPNFWILENPLGRIPDLIPELGKYKMKIQPYEYAGYAPNPELERYQKTTCLWGNFKLAPKNPVTAGRTISIHTRDQFLRSITPLGVAYATYLGNKVELR